MKKRINAISMISCHVKCYDMQLFQAEDDVVGQKTVIYVRFSLLSNNNHCVSWIASLKITFVYNIDRRENNVYFFYELNISQTKDFECDVIPVLVTLDHAHLRFGISRESNSFG